MAIVAPMNQHTGAGRDRLCGAGGERVLARVLERLEVAILLGCLLDDGAQIRSEIVPPKGCQR